MVTQPRRPYRVEVALLEDGDLKPYRYVSSAATIAGAEKIARREASGSDLWRTRIVDRRTGEVTHVG